jgi:sugar lactone lactonase YvrE
MIQAGAIFPDALRWLWRDYPQPIAKPKMHPLGDQHSGLVDVAPDWEFVSDGGNIPHETPEGTMVLHDVIPGSPFQKSASGIAADRQGQVFFSDPSGRRIYRIDSDGLVSTFVEDAGAARGLSFGPDGALYVCENHSNRIVSYAVDGKRNVRAENIACQDLAITRAGGIYFTQPGGAAKAGYLPPGGSKPVASPLGGMLAYHFINKSNGIRLSPDDSLVYVTDLSGKWVWSFQIQSDGSLANGEPFFRMETPDDSSDSAASGIAIDSRGLLYVATRLGIQTCDLEGRVVAIINGPEQAGSKPDPISGVAFGGRDHQYLYAAIGNQVYRRHLVRMPPQP